MPTFDAGPLLGEVLRACRAQRGVTFEVLVVDSGSTDGTLDVVATHPGVRLHTIPNAEFGHGRTRNLAAGLARGEVVAFLTQDATPAGDDWLAHLVAPFALDPRVAAVFGRQVPRPTGCPTVRRDVVEAFAQLGPERGVVVRQPAAAGGRPDWTTHFFSNVNAAVRREVLAEVPFRDVAYAEDRALAEDLAAAGYLVAYTPEAVVRHSHDYPLGAYFRRMYDEARGLREVGAVEGRTGALSLLARAVRGTVKDWAFVARDPSYGPAATLRWAVTVPLYNLARRAAAWLAAFDDLPPRLASALSLDARRRAAP